MSKVGLWLKEKWYYIVAALVFVGGIVIWLLTRESDDGLNDTLPSPIQKAKDNLHKNLSNARIEAAVKVAKAEGKEEVVKEEIKQISQETDKMKQLEQLAALAKRSRH